MQRELAEAAKSYRQLARELGVSHVVVGQWVRGERPLPPAQVRPMAEALGVDVDEFRHAVWRDAARKAVERCTARYYADGL